MCPLWFLMLVMLWHASVLEVTNVACAWQSIAVCDSTINSAIILVLKTWISASVTNKLEKILTQHNLTLHLLVSFHHQDNTENCIRLNWATHESTKHTHAHSSRWQWALHLLFHLSTSAVPTSYVISGHCLITCKPASMATQLQPFLFPSFTLLSSQSILYFAFLFSVIFLPSCPFLSLFLYLPIVFLWHTGWWPWEQGGHVWKATAGAPTPTDKWDIFQGQGSYLL